MNELNGANILITGGTGSFGQHFTEYLLKHYNLNKIVIYSRDEYKQFIMREKLKEYDEKLRFLIGNVRDKDRLYRAFDGIDYVVHTAALKQVPICEWNPFEAIKTNIYGAQNVVDAAIDSRIKKVIALSTDKAVNPINLYGATKLASDKLFIAANAYVGAHDTVFSVVRYGNVAGTRGSVIPLFKSLIKKGKKELPITDFRMTRFWISLKQAIELVLHAIENCKGGEIYVAKIPSFKVTDLAKSMLASVKLKEIGIRPGEKMHEVMITEDDSFNTFEYENYFIIYPNFEWLNMDRFQENKKRGKKVQELFRYSSDTNTNWLSVKELSKRISQL